MRHRSLDEMLQFLADDERTIKEMEARWAKAGITDRRGIALGLRMWALEDFYTWEKEERKRLRAERRALHEQITPGQK